MQTMKPSDPGVSDPDATAEGSAAPGSAAVASATDSVATSHEDRSQLHVAIVDDDVTIRSLARMLLARTDDMRVVGEAADGVDALDLVRDTSPDVVLVDLLMPRLGGHGLLPLLVRETPTTMLLVLTSLQAIDEADRSFALGAFAFLEKSVVGPSLADEIRELHSLFRRALEGETVWSPAGASRIRT